MSPRGGFAIARRRPDEVGGAFWDPRLWTRPYGVATKFWVLDVAGPVVPLPDPKANWLTCQIWFAVAGSGVAAA